MANNKKPLRCAIYTRKSTDEGLEKDFNSLDAQREACSAYVLSQAHEGWTQLADHYDDGGFSGGSMERPGLKQLLADIAAGKVDIIVVYKIDRLTRSLADFAKIVDTLDAAECSFVSVTQSFNTTSSMGRLTLNVLLSFAQFEREVGAERIRDKIAASKKRGMWMGGPVPLGYAVEDRKLVVAPEEAATVRDIMRRYLKTRGVPSLVGELELAGVVSKRRKMRDGSIKGGTPFRRGALAHLLSNRIYLGLITHKGKAYDGQHDAIVEQELFDRVQTRLASRGSERMASSEPCHISILAGRITDQHGRAMTPCHTQNHGKRYRYYASIPRDGSKDPAVRLPAEDLERATTRAIVALLRDANRLSALMKRLPDDISQNAITNAIDTAAMLEESTGRDLKRELHTLNLQVRVETDTLKASVDLRRLASAHTNNNPIPVSIIVPATSLWNGHEQRLKLEPAAGSPNRKNDALLSLLARAFEAREKLIEMDTEAVGAMPVRHRRHLERTAKLSYLAPDVVRAILDGNQPTNLSARKLVRAASLPLDWAEQRRLLLAN